MLLALREPPALPTVAAGLGLVRTVELVRENRSRHVDVHAADLVDHLGERVEVDDDNVVHLDVGEPANRPDREGRAADLEGHVDLVEAVAGHLHAQVARDREVIQAPLPGVGAQEHDRVGPLEARALLDP